MPNSSIITSLLLSFILTFCDSTFAMQLFSENDTLNKQYFDSASYKLYASPDGGFASGNNAYSDKAKVQEFNVANGGNIYGVLIHFGYKKFNSQNDSSYVRLNFYQLNGIGTNTISSSAACPGNIFYTDSIKIADIDTVNGNIFNYINPIYTNSNFAIGIDFNSLHQSDTIALYTNIDGMGGNREQSWERDLHGNWYSLKYTWTLDVDYAIFPIVNTSVGIDAISNKTRPITIWPNPSENGQYYIDIDMTEIKLIQVYNSSLQLVDADFTNFNQKIQISTKEKTSGVYFVKLVTKYNEIVVKKVIIK